MAAAAAPNHGAALADGAPALPRAAQRRLLGDYCVQDSALLVHLLGKLGAVVFVWQQARVAFTSPHDIINGGQMKRVTAAYCSQAWQENLVVALPSKPATEYQGAVVLDPVVGYYGGGNGTSLLDGRPLPPAAALQFRVPALPAAQRDRPTGRGCGTARGGGGGAAGGGAERCPRPELFDLAVAAAEAPDGYDFSHMRLAQVLQYQSDQVVATLDFASLYPSIIREHNLCPSTRIPDPDEPLNPAERFAAQFEAARRRRPTSRRSPTPR